MREIHSRRDGGIVSLPTSYLHGCGVSSVMAVKARGLVRAVAGTTRPKGTP